MQAWGPYGLEGVAAFFPAVAGSGTIAICECCFRNAASIDVAFRSPATSEVMADVKRVEIVSDDLQHDSVDELASIFRPFETVIGCTGLPAGKNTKPS
jgi:hypothetical protein